MAEEFKLNPGQQQVLDHKSGPLLVVAGAGTGKTSVVIKKIGQLLDQGVKPESILALTFTEKAAAEMLDRLLLSRTGFQLDIPITTFNSYGESLLREFGSHIGIGRNFRLMSEQAQIVFFRERIDDFKLDYFLPLSNMPDSVIGDILGVFSQLKQNIIHPEQYLDFANNLSDSEQTEQLDKKQHVELANAYKTYIDLCRANNVIDYDDQIYLCLSMLQKRPNIRQQLQDRYHTIFVDEFQDTNPMQSSLIDMLSDDSHNIIAVGDDDQSIYGFRGATLANILNFKQRYPESSEAALTVNYRSGQSILDAAYSLIKHNDPHRLEVSLGIDKRLTSNASGDEPQLCRFDDINQELNWITEDIAARIESGDKPGSMAVLARSRTNAARVHESLTRANIPHKLIGYSQDLYKQPVVRMLIEACRTLVEPNNNNSLHHTLISDLFRISNEVLAPIAAQSRYSHEQLEEVLSHESNSKIDEALDIIGSLKKDAATITVGRLMYELIDRSGYKDRLFAKAKTDDEAAYAVQNLGQFFDTLKSFESIANQPTAVEYLVSLPALQAAGEKTDDGTLEITDNEVNVLTVHKAKGLEWNTVYIPFCTDKSFPSQSRPNGLGIPERLKPVESSPADEHYAEERRLMYVATTRAKNNLVVSFSDKSAAGGRLKPSRFIDELFGQGTSDSAEVNNHSRQAQLSLLSIPTEAAINVAITLPKEIYDGNRFYLSVSQAAALLECPLNFYYKFVLKIPEPPTPKTTYGSQLHSIIESINNALIEDSLGPLGDYINELESGWSKSGYDSRLQQERALAQAKDTITRFYTNCQTQPKPIYVEHDFKTLLEPENIILRGRYDVVSDDGNGGVEIRDYKTSISVKTPDKAKRRASSSTQLTMYALAWQQSSGQLPSKLSLHFVDTDQIGSVRKTQKGIDGLRSRLYDSLQAALNGSYPAGNKHDYCLHPPVTEV